MYVGILWYNISSHTHVNGQETGTLFVTLPAAKQQQQ